MKLIKTILMPALLLIFAAAGYGWYIFNKKPADVRRQKADMEINAKDLLQLFQQNETAADARYVDKVIIVSGIVQSMQTDAQGKTTISLDTGDPMAAVTCSFYNEETAAVKQINKGSRVHVKGICTGMLSDVILNKCSLVK